MKSPFPGMDPYLEKYWEDVHTALIGYTRDALVPQLPNDLIARMEEKVYVEDDPRSPRIRRPDVSVTERPLPWRASQRDDADVAVLDAPMEMELAGDPPNPRSVMIYDVNGNHVVTAIEILSPWNKYKGRGLEEYLAKRNELVRSDVNLVEIDLVRTGDWMEMTRPYVAPARGESVYRATVSIPGNRPLHYPIHLRGTLPTIQIPLRPEEPPALLNLQTLVAKAYEMGRYDHIDYTRPCAPPLNEDDQKWANELLRAAGRL